MVAFVAMQRSRSPAANDFTSARMTEIKAEYFGKHESAAAAVPASYPFNPDLMDPDPHGPTKIRIKEGVEIWDRPATRYSI